MRRNILPHILWGSGLVIVIVICTIIVTMLNKKTSDYKQQIVDRDTTISSITQQWQELGPAVQGLVLIKDVSGGQEIRADNWQEFFTPVTYPERLNLSVVAPSSFTSTKYIRAGMSVGSVLTTDDIMDKRHEDSQRYYDIILDEYPVGLTPGKFIDIRVRFPFGQDFIALSHKEVKELNGPTIKLVLSEQEIYTYNSMLTDKVLYQAKLYSIEYLDTGAQQAADNFYPLNHNMQELLLKNPNALDIVRSEMKLSRELLESEMLNTVPADIEQKEAHYQQLQSQLAQLQAANSGAIGGQQSIFLARWAQQQAAAAGGDSEGRVELSWEDHGAVR